MNKKTVHVLGVPMDHGAGRRGVNMGPSAIRIAGLHAAIVQLGHDLCDHGDLHIPAPEVSSVEKSDARYLSLIASACEELARHVPKMFYDQGFPLVLGGDHSIAIGTIAGLAAEQHRRQFVGGDAASEHPTAAPKMGVIWFDAHGDINEPGTSPSGNIHGMPVACLLGRGPDALTEIGYPGPKVNPENFCQIGLRDIDPVERKLLRDSGIHTFTMADIDRRGMMWVLEQALRLASAGTQMLHCSFDIDGVDPRIAPGTGTQKLGGLTYREAHLCLELIAESGLLTSMEMVEVNPTLDDKNKTAELAVGLISSALGSRIL